MPRTGSFTYELTVDAPPAAAAALLSQFNRHRELHPLIVAVRPLPAPAGVLRRYAISDRVPFGPFRLPLTYTADVLADGPSAVVTAARQSPATTVRNETRLTPAGTGTHIAVQITLTAPAPLFRFAFSQARAAHAVLADRLRAALAVPA